MEMLRQFSRMTKKDIVRIEYIIDSIKVIPIVDKCEKIDLNG